MMSFLVSNALFLCIYTAILIIPAKNWNNSLNISKTFKFRKKKHLMITFTDLKMSQSEFPVWLSELQTQLVSMRM